MERPEVSFDLHIGSHKIESQRIPHRGRRFYCKKGQSPPEGYYNLEKMLTDFIAKGGSVRACGTCLRARGLSREELVEGVEVGTMMGLANWIKESRVVLSF